MRTRSMDFGEAWNNLTVWSKVTSCLAFQAYQYSLKHAYV